MSDPVFRHPDRPPMKMRPLKALHHFRKLVKNKEDTEQVFHIFQALPRRKFLDEAKSFMESAKGRAVVAAEPFLPPILDDHAALRRFPMGSVAHAYADFMEREGLTAAGLVAEFDKFQGGRRFGDMVEWYANRQRDTHDLLHVLTGYGRDALGEQCVLAFTYGQNPAPANLFIAYAGGLNMKRRVKTRAPVFQAINEARKLGRGCPRISEQPITQLLAEPLDSARARLKITPPRYYEQAHAAMRAEDIDPYDMLARAA